MEELGPEETELVGMWLDLGSSVTGDAVYDRIEWLAANRLKLLAEKEGGLGRLFRDPADDRLWLYERPFPGGPPQLRVMTLNEARQQFDLKF